VQTPISAFGLITRKSNCGDVSTP